MRGSLREKRPGVFEARIFVGNDPVTGRTKHVSRTLYGPRRQCEDQLAELIVDSNRRGRRVVEHRTVGDLLVDWLECADLGDRTRKVSESAIRLHVLPALGTMALHKLGSQHLSRLYRGLVEKGLAPSYVARIHTSVSSALTYAVNCGDLAVNPAAHAIKPSGGGSRSTALHIPDARQVDAIVATTSEKNPELAAFFLAVSRTGARPGELLAVRRNDVDLVAATINLRATKTNTLRTISLSPGTVDRLAGLYDRLDERAAVAGVETVANPYVWSNQLDLSAPWGSSWSTHGFRRNAGKAGVQGCRLYDLRHFHATQLLGAGVPVHIVAQRLGHANPAMTLRVYAHWIPAVDQAAAGIIDSVFRSDTEVRV